MSRNKYSDSKMLLCHRFSKFYINETKDNIRSKLEKHIQLL